MQVSDRPEYRHALIIGDTVLTANSLRERINAIAGFISLNGINSYSKVMVFISSAEFLLPSLWALLKKGAICFPVDPDNTYDPVERAFQCEVDFILTENQYKDKFSEIPCIAVDNITFEDARQDRKKDDLIKEGSFLFFNESDGKKGPQIQAYTNEYLVKLFEKLDMSILPDARDVLLLSLSTGYSWFVSACIWASSRGIPIVLDELKDSVSFENMDPDKKFQMGFGLFHFGSYTESSAHNKYHSLFDTVKFADTNGFECVWTPERHFNDFGGLFPNPSVLSAAIAVSTSRVQIRCGSIVSPLHHPVRIAEDWSLIDNLSNGRVAISFASGWQCDDFIFFPENYPVRHQCMMDQINTVKRLWKGEKLTFKNGLNKEIEIAVYPKPIQKELPVWITVSGRTETFIDAGKIGANILTHLLWQDTGELIEKIAAYRKSLKENGFDPKSRKVSIMVHTYVGESNESVKEKVREPLKNYIKSSTQLIQAMAKSNVATIDAKDVVGRYGDLNSEIPSHLMDEVVEMAFNRFFEQAALLGRIDKCEQLIRKLRNYDVDEVACLIDFGLKPDDIMKGLGFLKELKEKYAKSSALPHPVTIVFCPGKTLEASNTDPALLRLLAGMKRILINSTDGEDIPGELSTLVSIIYDNDGSAQVHSIKNTAETVDTGESFRSSLSAEF